MILELKSILECKDFIDQISNDYCFSDPHFLYNNKNLYKAFEKDSHKVYAVYEKN